MLTLHANSLVVATLVLVATVPGVGTQPTSQAELAAKMTGTWKLNRELSPNLTSPTPGRRGGGPSFAVITGVPQRGGRGSGAGNEEPPREPQNLMPEEVAAQAALSTIQQVPLELTIQASETEVTLIEPRGQSHFRIDGRNSPVEVPGGSIKVKSRWDRDTLRQDFSSAQRVLRRSWSLDSNGHLVLRQRIESATFNTKESQAVFDRQ